MCFAVPCEEYKVNPVLARAMDRIFILHADHEQNASTSTVRLAGSSGANPFACIAAGIACLWGPAHGGANEAALNMLAEIGTVDRIPEFIARAKDKNDPFRLMGFGHRVYKNYDPRAKIMQKTTHEVLGELGIKDDPLLEVAMELEKIALTDEYFIEKKLYPNIDFYSGITLKALGFPTTMFTVLFARRPHRRLDRAVEGNDRGSAAEDRPPAPALYRRAGARLRADRQALIGRVSRTKKRPAGRFFMFGTTGELGRLPCDLGKHDFGRDLAGWPGGGHAARDFGKAVLLPGAQAGVVKQRLELAGQVFRAAHSGRRIPARSRGRRSGWAAAPTRP